MKFKVGDRRKIGNSPYYITIEGEIIGVRSNKPLRGGNYGGYRGAILCYDSNRFIVRHHHLVMRWFVGPRPSGMVINHKDGNKLNNRLDNLEYCSPRDNREHAKANRLYHSGSRCSWSKLSEESAQLIRNARKIGMPIERLAKAFEVNKKAIRQILTGKTWNYEKV